MGSEKENTRNLVSKNLLVTLASKVFYIGTRFFIPPIVLSYVTLEEYGIWACCFILISYMGMSVFGFSNVYVRFVAEYNARGETDRINRLLSTGVTITTPIALVLLGGLWLLLPGFIDLFGISPELGETASFLIFGTACAFLFTLVTSAFDDTLNGLQRISAHTAIWILSCTFEFAAIVALLLCDVGIHSLLWAYIARSVLGAALSAIVCYRSLPGLSIRFGRVDRASLKLFFSFGMVTQLAGFLGMFLYSIERVLSGIFLGVRATGLFELGQKLPIMASQVPCSMSGVLFPAFSHMQSQDRKDEIRRLFIKGSRYMNLMCGLVMGFLAAFSAPLLLAWVGAKEEIGDAIWILSLATIAFQVHIITGPGSSYHRGAGNAWREIVYPVVQIAFLAVLVGGGFAIYGVSVLVVAVAVGASMVLSALIYTGYTLKVVGVPSREFLLRVIVPGFVPYLTGFACYFAATSLAPYVPFGDWTVLPRFGQFAWLGVWGTIYSLLTAGVLFRFTCDWGEREFLRRQIAHTLGDIVRVRRRPRPEPSAEPVAEPCEVTTA